VRWTHERLATVTTQPHLAAATARYCGDSP
jgi:hypothetical protein